MIRSVFWRPLDEIGLEHLLFERASDAIRADGLILQTQRAKAFRARYKLDPDGNGSGTRGVDGEGAHHRQ